MPQNQGRAYHGSSARAAAGVCHHRQAPSAETPSIGEIGTPVVSVTVRAISSPAVKWLRSPTTAPALRLQARDSPPEAKGPTHDEKRESPPFTELFLHLERILKPDGCRGGGLGVLSGPLPMGPRAEKARSGPMGAPVQPPLVGTALEKPSCGLGCADDLEFPQAGLDRPPLRRAGSAVRRGAQDLAGLLPRPRRVAEGDRADEPAGAPLVVEAALGAAHRPLRRRAGPGSSPASGRSPRSPSSMPLLPAEKVGPLLIALLLTFTLASATQDIAIDAWAVDCRHRTRPRADERHPRLGLPRRGDRRPAAALCWWPIAAAGRRPGRSCARLFAALAVGALFLKDGERALSSSGVKRTTRELVRVVPRLAAAQGDAAGGALRAALQARRPGDRAHDRDLLGRPRHGAHRDRPGRQHPRPRR